MYFHTHVRKQAAVFIPEDEQHYRVAMRNWSISFARTLEQHLQVGGPCAP